MSKLIILIGVIALVSAFILFSGDTSEAKKTERLMFEKLQSLSYCEKIKSPQSFYPRTELQIYDSLRCLIELEEKKQAKECNSE